MIVRLFAGRWRVIAGGTCIASFATHREAFIYAAGLFRGIGPLLDANEACLARLG